ncbi:DUF305 domain-containing protein, partial [Nocardioides ginsengisoli]
MHRTTLRRLASATGAITVALSLAACGGADETDGTTKKPAAVETARNGDVFTAADVDFATAMIPHHAQALQMALLAQDRPLPPDVRALVDRIQEAQAPEVETMTTWLTAWGKEVPPTTMDHANAGHDMSGDSGMPGMMGSEQMDALEKLSDAEFPRRWMEMMIEHHQGAIAMAKVELASGEFADAVALAETIVDGQTSEISTMRDLIDQ